jgi:integrase
VNKQLVASGTYDEISHPDMADAERAAAYAREPRAPATDRAYAADWRDWEAWCAERGASALPSVPTAVGVYLADLADRGRKASTIARRAVAITRAHRLAGVDMVMSHPTIRDVLAWVRRTHGSGKEAKTALLVSDVRRCVAAMPRTLIGARDRAVLLMLFAGAFRRSELVALDLPDIQISSRRMTVTVGRSKTDQQGQGAVIGIPRGKRETCPVRAVEQWIEAAGIKGGPLFRSVNRHGQLGPRLPDAAVAEVVKRAVGRVGLDPRKFAGHSGRSGFITQALVNGADIGAIRLHARQRSVATMRGYVQAAAAINNPGAKSVGL